MAETRENPGRALEVKLTKFAPQIQSRLPVGRGLRAEAIIGTAVSIYRESSDLQVCSETSLLAAVVQCAELGLSFSKALGYAYLIPFAKQATLVLGYRGLLKLAMNNPRVMDAEAHIVRELDFFDFEYGSSKFLKHKPAKAPPMEYKPGRPADVVAYYALVRYRGGGLAFNSMSADEVEAHRVRFCCKSSRQTKQWLSNYEAMGRKTPIRALAKDMPLSPELETAMALDTYADAQQSQGLEAKYALNELVLSESRSDRLAAELGATDAPAAGTPLEDAGDGSHEPEAFDPSKVNPKLLAALQATGLRWVEVSRAAKFPPGTAMGELTSQQVGVALEAIERQTM